MKKNYRAYEFDDIRQYQEESFPTITEATQLSRGKFHGKTESVRLENMHVSRCYTNQTVRDIGRLSDGHVAFVFHERENSFFLKGRYYGRGGLCCIAADSRWEAVSHKDAQRITCLVPTTLVQAHFSAEQQQKIHKLATGDDEVFLCPPAYQKPVLDLVNKTLTQLAQEKLSIDNDGALAEIKARVLKHLANAVDQIVFEDMRANASGRLVDRVLDRIEAEPGMDLKVADLAAALHTSPRNIELAFKTYLNVTPKEYLVNLRLNRVREDLLGGAENKPSIKDIARRYGFSHMGNFSRAYFKLFCELPSDTVKYFYAQLRR